MASQGADGEMKSAGAGDARGSGDTEAAAATAGAASAARAAAAAGPAGGESVRVDSWIWSVRLVKTRSMGATACRGGHVRVNGERVKPAYSVRVGDEVRLRHEGRERVVVVKRVIRKRVGAPVAVECYVDNSPPPPPREAVAPAGLRDRGAGRPTKRDRRELERLRGMQTGSSGPVSSAGPSTGTTGATGSAGASRRSAGPRWSGPPWAGPRSSGSSGSSGTSGS
ncbi:MULTISPECIES: RNA-binding S4 domain-containing protein [unclassified Streptomyces]|uniref:RNA-binding S4 domain-containing protein n=1 Tax=unclassified Streptomyces TaxID=2593676 RepID=UPI002258C7CD|nr:MULTISPECIES: RNA-binding S4 domain-containing protein [unclassified Streptomyces]MCX4991653.1 RNA-binding S4 domain-containing protein [Streptomyces sp. NBC_00568]MCX5003111.1 RNA-binding S4 domain-containing protein [Streptomyces sp. NBC_00638]